MYEDIMQGRRGLAGIGPASEEGVVIADSQASNDQVQDFFADDATFDQMQDQFADDVQQLFEPVGGGPYPFVKTKRVGPIQFADDLLTSGDEGIGFAQARRLKQKLRRNRRRITETGYAVAGDTPYAFGDLGKIRISFKNPFGKKSLFGKAKKLVKKIKPLKIASYVAGGVVGGSLLQKGFNLAKGLATGGDGGGGEPVAVTTDQAPGVPVGAPTGATDAVGTPIPAAIQAASAAAVSPIPTAIAPTASEDVAAQVQEDQTGQAMEAGVASGFTMPNFSDPKVLISLGVVGFLIFTQMGKKGRRRSRRR